MKGHTHPRTLLIFQLGNFITPRKGKDMTVEKLIEELTKLKNELPTGAHTEVTFMDGQPIEKVVVLTSIIGWANDKYIYGYSIFFPTNDWP